VSFDLDSLLNIEISAASKYAQGIHEAPAAVTVITSADIEAHGYRTLEEVMQMVRGFYVSNDRNYSYLGVRGFSRPTDYNDRIVLLLNGHSMNENVFGSAFFGTELGIDLEHVERIEIIRGPGSALYGTNAMFAVINVVTKTGNTLNGGRARVDAGSYGHVGGAAEFGRRENSGLDWSLSGQWADVQGQRLYFPEYDELATNYGFSENDDWDEYFGFVGSAQYKEVAIQGSFSNRTKAVPTGSYETEFDHDNSQTEDRRAFLECKIDHPWGNNRQLMGRLYYDHYHYNGTYPYEIDQNDRSTGNWAGGEAQLRWDLRADNRLVFGVEHQNNMRADYELWDADTSYFDGNFPFSLWSAYLQDEAQLTPSLAVTAGVRHDYNSTLGSTTTPRGALVFSPPRLGTLKFMYGEAYRAPNVYEREIGGGELTKRNPDLEPERISTYEAVWEYPLQRQLWASVSIYRYNVRNLIDPTIDPADSLTVFMNVGRARASGAEIELDGRSKGGRSVTVSYSFQDAIDPDTDLSLTNSPQHSAKFVGAVPVGPHLTLAVRGLYESRRLTVYDTWTEPYFIAGLSTTLRPKLQTNSAWHGLLTRTSLTLTINNIFDTDYQTPGGLEHRQPSIAQNGRNLLMRLRIEL